MWFIGAIIGAVLGGLAVLATRSHDRRAQLEALERRLAALEKAVAATVHA